MSPEFTSIHNCVIFFVELEKIYIQREDVFGRTNFENKFRMNFEYFCKESTRQIRTAIGFDDF